LSAWLYLLTREDRTEVEVTPELVANDAALAQAYLRLSQLSDDEEQRLIDEQNDEEEAEQMQLQAVQTAKNEGKMEGKMEAKMEAKMEGQMEAKMELARNMLADREPLEKIIKYTGLSQDQIESLQTKSP
jgi:predicted transposase/invertase (TIGR01784 family)